MRSSISSEKVSLELKVEAEEPPLDISRGSSIEERGVSV